ncbi:MAG: ABC transporter substrate-binding protein [Planctomycetes bacterium]|nr:ABC transporter substrate-binding protein [Planctomycetota bacterium]
MKKIILAIICVAAGVWVLGNYAKQLSSENALETQKTKAEKKNTSKYPERIVSLSPNITEILFELGLGEKVVAVSNNSNYPAEAATKQKVGTFWQPDTESILATRADLIITLWFAQQKSVADSLKRLGYDVLSLKIESRDELIEAIGEIAEVAGAAEQGKELIERLNEKLEQIEAKYEKLEKVKVLWVIQAEPLRVVGRGTFVDGLVVSAGGVNAIGETIYQYPPISTEELLKCGADVIIQSAMGSGNLDRQQEQAEKFWKRYPNLPAVKNDRIYVVESDTILRLGPRLADGLELIGGFLHPEIKD